MDIVRPKKEYSLWDVSVKLLEEGQAYFEELEYRVMAEMLQENKKVVE